MTFRSRSRILRALGPGRLVRICGAYPVFLGARFMLSPKWSRDYIMGKMTRHVIAHSRPTLGPEEERAAVRAIRSGMLGGGEEVGRFERDLEKVIGRGRATAVHTGSAALHLALLGLGVGAGDRVILPTYTCAAVLNAVKYTGAEGIL